MYEDSMEKESCAKAAEKYRDDDAPDTAEQEKVKAVLLVGKCVLRETGNATTLDRLGRTVNDAGWECVMRDPDSLADCSSLPALVKQHNIVVALGIHAYRSAPVLLACQELGVPYVVMFGGTDVNECVKEAAKKDVMSLVVAGARSLVAFQTATRDTVLQIWPSLNRDKIWVLPQAVQVNPDPDFDVLSYLESVEAAHVATTTSRGEQETRKTSVSDRDAEMESGPVERKEKTVTEGNRINKNSSLRENGMSRESKGVSAQNICSETLINDISQNQQHKKLPGTLEPLPDVFNPLVLLVAGLRPVKDVLYLAEAWSEWQKARRGRGRFLIIGPTLDPQYTVHVHAQVHRLSGVRVCPTLAPSECQALMSSATVLVNSSRSESMSSAILEAMALGTPVLAKDIPGNASLITHGQTGLLYASPDAFLQGLNSLLQDSQLQKGLVTAARDHVARFHSLQQEKKLLQCILQQAML